MPLAIDTEEHGGATLVIVRGDVDLSTAPNLREGLLGVLGPRRVVIDLERVGFLDSAGLGVLVGALKRAREHGGDVELVCTNRAVLQPLEITGLDDVFAIHSRREDALAG